MDFVTLEIALKLREKGFREECIAYYHTDGELLYNRDQYRGGNYKSLLRSYNSLPKNPIGCEQIDAPTISQVLKWLREEKKIHIEIGFGYYGFCWDLTLNIKYVKGDNGSEWDLLNCEKYVEIDNQEDHSTYEECALCAIEYVIDNLI